MRSTRYGAVGVALALLTLSPPVMGAGGETVDRSTPTSTLELSYDLYVGGIALGKVAMSARFQGADYKAISTLETSGIVNAFWQSKIEAASNGVVHQGDIRPALYDSYSQNRKDERRQVTLTFGPEGPKSLFSDPPYPETRYKVNEDQQKKTLDPLSAAVFLTNSVNAANAKPCEAIAPVFDGRRRYDVSLSFVKNTDVRMDNGLYRGPVSVCQVRYNQIAGYQQTLVEQGKRLPPMFAWVTPVRSKLDPSRQFMLPLRVWAESEYGIVVALASSAKVDAAPVGASN